MRRILIFILVFVNVVAIDFLDYQTGELVSIEPSTNIYKSLRNDAIVDWQSPEIEAAVENSRDYTSTASLWQHGPFWGFG